jgi:hypothetical protein
MSMIANLLALSPERLRELMDDPSSLWDFLYPESEEEADGRRDNHLDLDKTWDAIHFTLNGERGAGDEPLFLTILGGEEIGEDNGYGPARYLLPDQVKDVAQALRSIPPADFAARFDPAALTKADVYPGIWDEAGLEYVQPSYDALRDF